MESSERTQSGSGPFRGPRSSRTGLFLRGGKRGTDTHRGKATVREMGGGVPPANSAGHPTQASGPRTRMGLDWTSDCTPAQTPNWGLHSRVHSLASNCAPGPRVSPPGFLKLLPAPHSALLEASLLCADALFSSSFPSLLPLKALLPALHTLTRTHAVARLRLPSPLPGRPSKYSLQSLLTPAANQGRGPWGDHALCLPPTPLQGEGGSPLPVPSLVP